jgi:CheY-like chemotaxis protein
MSPPRVLFIDPRGDALSRVRAKLPRTTDIESADDVIGALRRAERERFDLILCDIDTDGMADLLTSRAPAALLDGDRIIALAGPQHAAANALLGCLAS